MRLLSFVFVLTCAQHVAAEELGAAMAELSGREVEVSGLIGTNLMDRDELGFKSDGGDWFSVTFDAGREARKQLDGCAFELFGGTPCRFEGMAELSWEGSRLELILYKATHIGPPEAE